MRAGRAGVRISESEARLALGLPGEPPEGETLLRFNVDDAGDEEKDERAFRGNGHGKPRVPVRS